MGKEMKKITLERAFNTYLKHVTKPNTRRSYGQVLHEMAAFVGAAKPITQIDAFALIEYIADLREGDNAISTINKKIKTIKAFFNWLEANVLIETSPAHGLKLLKEPRTDNADKSMTDEELKRLLNYLRHNPKYTQHYAFTLFLADTYARQIGARTLTLDRLDLYERSAVVIEKFELQRRVHFGEICAFAIEAWLAKRGEQVHDYVFCSRNGQWAEDAISQFIRRVCNRVGNRSLGSHSLRQRGADMLTYEGFNADDVAQGLGNTAPVARRYYMPSMSDHVKSAIKRHHIFSKFFDAPASNIVDFSRAR